jgi:predicted Zn finger-like uncharacterized protein
MKFLCPSCKAKYQIADEKVAGRSVRMKCRKCGYVIQVSSVAGLGDALPGSDPPAAMDALSDHSAAPPPAVAAPSAFGSEAIAEPKSAASSTSAQRPEVKKFGSAGLRPLAPKPAFTLPAKELATARKAPPAKSSPRKPVPAGASVASPAAGAPPRVAAPDAPSSPAAAPPVSAAAPSPAAAGAPTTAALPAVSLKSDKRTIQGGVGGPLPPVAPKPVAPLVNAPTAAFANSLSELDDEDESTRIADVGALAGALAGAFSLAVGRANETQATDTASMPADEWFVGINGVPVGPIRLSELRSKAASGSVNRESLVWRDGFEDWRPLGTFPELVAIVDESVSSARMSLTPFTPSVATAFGPMPVVADPFLAPGTTVTGVPGAAAGEAYAGTGVTSTAVVTDDVAEFAARKSGGTSPAAWIAIVMAVLFGLTIGFVLFKTQSKTIEVVKYVDRPVPGAASGAVAAPDGKSSPIDDPAAPADAKNPTRHATGPARSSGPALAAEPDKGISGLKGLSGLNSLGPNRGPDGTSGPSGTVSGAGQLDGAQIQSTVARYTGSVKRACWQPALDTRDKDAPTTARVNVAITVLPSGSVQNAAVNGDPKGYRGLSQCISSRVRGWQFPPSGDTTTVNVPFVFAAQ